MTSVLRPPSHAFISRSPSSGGILLNPSPYGRLSALPQSSYPSRSNQSLSSSTSSLEDVNTPLSSVHATPPPSLNSSLSPPITSDEDRNASSRRGSGAEYGASGSRRIRFAPLPDPRRAVLITEHGEELPLPSVFDDDDPSGIPNPKLRDLHTSPHSSLLLGDAVVAPKEVSTIVTSGPSSSSVQTSRPSPSSPAHVTESPTPSTATITSAALFPSASSSRLAKRLFYPFRQKGGDSGRSGSRDSSSSRDDGSSSWGTPLGHWRSADEGFRTTSTNPEALFRAQSATSTTQPKPKRMLNGRVYGARKHQSTNVFDNIPDEEPEFVEWGYGGMGSVKAGGMWAKVQSDQKIFIGHDEERGRRGAPQSSPDNEDDGSGMGWVKRRREERERKKLEEAAPKAASKPDDDAALTLHSSPTPVPATTHDISTVMPSQPTHEIDTESSDESEEEVDDSEDDDADQVCLFRHHSNGIVRG
jgi:hypothetical protein